MTSKCAAAAVLTAGRMEAIVYLGATKRIRLVLSGPDGLEAGGVEMFVDEWLNLCQGIAEVILAVNKEDAESGQAELPLEAQP